MARTWDTHVFHPGTDQYPGADTATRRSLGMLNRDNPTTTKILEAAKFLGIKARAPYWRRNCWAHVGFPNMNVVILVRNFNDVGFAARYRERWSHHKHKLLLVIERTVERMELERLAAELKEALASLGRMK